MPLKSPWTVDVPEVSVPTFVFTSPSQPLPETPLIIDPAAPDTNFLSLSSYRHWSQRFAAGLDTLGFKKGDRLLLVSGNSVVYPVVLMGTLMAGGIISGASTTIDFEKISRQAQAIEPSIIVASLEGYEMASKVATAISLPHDFVYLLEPEYLFGKVNPARENLQFPLADASYSYDWQSICHADDISAINFTSGSSGDAKGVFNSHRNMVANAVQYIEQQKNNPFGPENDDNAVWVMWTPMFHVIGQNQYCIIAPKRGLRNYIMETFDLELLLQHTERYKATELILFPPIVIALLRHPAARRYDLSSVTTAILGGAPIRESLVRKLEKMMPNDFFRVVQGWGMTEFTALGINALPTALDQYTVGQLMPNCEAKIMTPDGLHELGPGQPGELWIRGPNVAHGYWNRSEKTTATFFPDQWLRTGDFGYYNTQERWLVRDRFQDVIYTADGNYILPTDLESILLDIPGVIDAGVASVQLNDDLENQAPRAYVVLDHTVAGNSLDSIDAAFNASVKEYEHLRGGIFEVKDLPRLPSGKVDRRMLQQMDVCVDEDI